MEQWKAIPGYEGYYEASTMGLIRSIDRVVPHKKHGLCKQKSKVLKYALDAKGYPRVALKKLDSFRTYTIHRLVALTFMGDRPDKHQINHISGIKSDNRVSNLEYCTHSENVIHSVRMGLQKPRKGTLNGMSILTDQDVREIREYVANCGKRYYGRDELAKRYGVSSAHIKDIVTGRRGAWSHV